MSFVHLPKIHPHLYLGDMRGAHAREWGGVLCTAGCNPPSKSPTMRYEFHDTEDEALQSAHQAALHIKNGALLLAQLLRRADRQEADVLVHCVAGINRSASTIVAYAINNGWSADDAIAYVREMNAKRRNVPVDAPSAVTNRVFKRALMIHRAAPQVPQ